jgi:hypothetical protein
MLVAQRLDERFPFLLDASIHLHQGVKHGERLHIGFRQAAATSS